MNFEWSDTPRAAARRIQSLVSRRRNALPDYGGSLAGMVRTAREFAAEGMMKTPGMKKMAGAAPARP
jgi:hypothetical protein